jgi:hypothetical protein
MTREQLSEIERLCEEATRGAWVHESNGIIHFVLNTAGDDLAAVQGETDAAFIIAARTAIPEMIRHIRSLEAIKDAAMSAHGPDLNEPECPICDAMRDHELLNAHTKQGGA